MKSGMISFLPFPLRLFFVALSLPDLNPLHSFLHIIFSYTWNNNEKYHWYYVLLYFNVFIIHICSKRKCKAVPLRHAGPKGKRTCSPYSFLTSTQDGVSGQRQAPGCTLPPGRLGGPQNCSGHRGYRKNLLPCWGSNSARLSVVRHYTNLSTPAPPH
jgi:hypothetical protein